MSTYSPSLGEVPYLPKKPEAFLSGDYFHSLAAHAERGRLSDRFLTLHLGSTSVGKLVEKTAPVEVATRLNAITPLKLAYAIRGWRATQARLHQEHEYKQVWADFENSFVESAEAKPAATVLQIGAYDGVTHDRVNPLLNAHPGWNAVLVEPMPVAFEKLQQNYADRPNTLLVNAAITSADGPVDMHHIKPNNKTPLFIDLTATSNPKTLELFQEAGGEMVTTQVDGLSLPTLLTEVNLQPSDIDLLFLDAEGCDFAILQQLLASEQDLPPFIVAEHDHMSDTEYYGVVEQLYQKGYRVRAIAHDLLAEKAA